MCTEQRQTIQSCSVLSVQWNMKSHWASKRKTSEKSFITDLREVMRVNQWRNEVFFYYWVQNELHFERVVLNLHTRTHTHTHTQTHTHTLSLSLSLTHTHTYIHTHTLSHILSHTHTHILHTHARAIFLPFWFLWQPCVHHNSLMYQVTILSCLCSLGWGWAILVSSKLTSSLLQQQNVRNLEL